MANLDAYVFAFALMVAPILCVITMSILFSYRKTMPKSAQVLGTVAALSAGQIYALTRVRSR